MGAYFLPLRQNGTFFWKKIFSFSGSGSRAQRNSFRFESAESTLGRPEAVRWDEEDQRRPDAAHYLQRIYTASGGPTGHKFVRTCATEERVISLGQRDQLTLFHGICVICVTRATLKLLTRPGVWDTGWNENILLIAKVKREDWTGRKREKVGQLCPSTEAGAVQGWATAGSWCQLYSCNQSINDCIIMYSNSLTKKRPRIGSNQQLISFIQLPKIEDWISLSSGYHNFILKDTLYREQVGGVWKWVILIWVGSQPFLTCLREFFSVH